MKTQTVYKVVFSSDSYNLSDKTLSSVKYRNSECDLIYNLHSINHPKIGKIFCFDTLQNAINFARNYVKRETHIFKCIGTNPTKIKKVCKWTIDFKEFWRLKANHKSTNNLALILSTKGTLLVDSIQFETEIKGWN